MDNRLVITTKNPAHIAQMIEPELELGQEIVGVAASEEPGEFDLVIDLGDSTKATREQTIFLAREEAVIFWEVISAEFAPAIEQPEPIRDWAARTFACSKNVAIRPAYTGEAVR